MDKDISVTGGVGPSWDASGDTVGIVTDTWGLTLGLQRPPISRGGWILPFACRRRQYLMWRQRTVASPNKPINPPRGTTKERGAERKGGTASDPLKDTHVEGVRCDGEASLEKSAGAKDVSTIPTAQSKSTLLIWSSTWVQQVVSCRSP